MRQTIDNGQQLSGKQLQMKYYENGLENDTFFPKGVHIDDIDRAVRDVFKTEFEVTSEGEKVPFLDIFSIQRFSEYMKTWQSTDETNTVKLPFTLLVKEPAEKGTNLSNAANIPGFPTFPLWKRNIVRNGKATVDYYKIPQPVNIDLTYKFHIFTMHQRLVNKMDELMLHQFKSLQYYVVVNGHYMPMFLDTIDDASETGDIDKRRYYQRVYVLKVKGYLLREEDFELVSSLNKINIKIGESIVKDSRVCIVNQLDLDCDLCLNFKFNRKSPNSNTYRVPQKLEFYYDNQSISNDYNYFLNGQLVTLPFIADVGDELTVAHNMGNSNVINIQVCGKKIT
jgi:hypothetical protein